MSSDDINSKLDKLLKNDDTENFYSFVSEIIEENKEYVSDLEQNLNLIYNILISDMNESNHETKMAFICLFFEILISENIDFTLYLDKLLNLIIKTNIYSDENIKRIINICSNATLSKTTLYKKLINFAKNKVEYLYIIFSLVGFKDIIIDTLSENWELIFDLMNSQEVKLNSTDIKNVLKCLELLINLSEDKFKPFASSALYQALDYLSETDIELQKRSLMIIYSLSKFCDEQLQPLSEHIVDFLKVLEKGKNVEINNLCNTMLKHFTGNEDEIEENENENENRNDNVEENEENENDENDNDNENNIIDNDDYPENKDNQEEQNEQIEQNEQNEQNERNFDLNEVDDTKPEDLIKNNTNNNISEEYDYNYQKRPKINMQNNIEINQEEQKEKYIEYEIKPKENKREIIYENQNDIEAYPKKINSNKKENKIQMNKYKPKPKEEYEENNEQMNQEIENSNDNDNNNDNFYNIDIDAIMKKIKDLSNKQIIILNSIEQYKSDTERIINQKKLKIKSLEKKIEDLEEKIRIEKNKRKNRGANPGRTNYQMRRKNNNENNNYKNKYENEDDDEYNDYYRYGK